LTDKGNAVAEATDDFFEDFMDLSVLSGTHQILQHKLAGDPPFFLADALTAGQGCRISAYAAEYFLYVKNCSISSSAYKRIRATISRPLT
ncbi:MAG: hypothetical protein NWE76_09280, partial [Candidatus Bathyarchaeota archaeon]|nr:hypothetical protein [Candidatus Bathyarchaeota archaeon]